MSTLYSSAAAIILLMLSIMCRSYDWRALAMQHKQELLPAREQIIVALNSIKQSSPDLVHRCRATAKTTACNIYICLCTSLKLFPVDSPLKVLFLLLTMFWRCWFRYILFASATASAYKLIFLFNSGLSPKGQM